MKLVNLRSAFGLIPLSLVWALACQGGDDSTSENATTMATVGGSAGTAGSSAVGMAGGGTAGSSAMGGSAGAAGITQTAGSGGDAGAGGEMVEAGPEPSMGCGKMDPPSGEMNTTIQGQGAEFFISIPDAYDPETPYPLVFGFHGRNLDYRDCLNANCAGLRDAAGQSAVIIYMSSIGNGWEGQGELEINVEYFTTMLERAKSDYCIDQARVFVTGSSSGASFTNILGCRFGEILRGVAPVAGNMNEKQNCTGQVAAMVIHGVDDYHVQFTSGEDARDTYLDWNSCTMETDIDVATMHAEVVADRESHQCAYYQGCDEKFPVAWCEHSEGGYDGSTHGWPLFAGAEVWNFFNDLPY